MGLVFTIMMPIGVFIIRLCKGKCRIWIHAVWQTFSWALLISGLASGIRVGKILDRVCSLSFMARMSKADNESSFTTTLTQFWGQSLLCYFFYSHLLGYFITSEPAKRRNGEFGRIYMFGLADV